MVFLRLKFRGCFFLMRLFRRWHLIGLDQGSECGEECVTIRATNGGSLDRRLQPAGGGRVAISGVQMTEFLALMRIGPDGRPDWWSDWSSPLWGLPEGDSFLWARSRFEEKNEPGKLVVAVAPTRRRSPDSDDEAETEAERAKPFRAVDPTTADDEFHFSSRSWSRFRCVARFRCSNWERLMSEKKERANKVLFPNQYQVST